MFPLNVVGIAAIVFVALTTLCRAFGTEQMKGRRVVQRDFELYLKKVKDDADLSQHQQTFASLGLSFDLQQAASKQGWNTPTNIQEIAMPILLDAGQNNNICVEAPTGSGKTATFVLPLLQLIAKDKQHDHLVYGSTRKIVRSLILVPTRELCMQISSVIESLTSSEKMKVRSAAIYGGVPIEPQMEAFFSLFLDKNEDKFPDIIVATPGRLVDVLNKFDNDPSDLVLERKLVDALDRKSRGRDDSTVRQKQIQDENLDKRINGGVLKLGKLLMSQLSYVVLDEADRLLSAGFKDEMDAVMTMVHNSKNNEEAGLRKWLCSATFPKTIKPAVKRLLGSTGENEEDGGYPINYIRSIDTKVNAANDSAPPTTILQRVIKVEEESRTQALRYLIENNSKEEWDRILVFVATRYASEMVSKKLRRVGLKAVELHGKLDQQTRMTRLQKFGRGTVQILVATDLASRGLDIRGLPVVVNYDLPRSPTDYTHRVGRTGRAGKCLCATLFFEALRFTYALIAIR